MKYKKQKRYQQPTSKFKSKLEEVFNDFLEQNEISFGYEDFKISYLKPEKPSKYTPDFNCITNENLRIIFETKGQFLTSDRRKHLQIKQQYPDLDIRFVFSNMNARIGKKSKTTYAIWCERNGFQYANKHIPNAWIEEIKNGSKSD